MDDTDTTAFAVPPDPEVKRLEPLLAGWKAEEHTLESVLTPLPYRWEIEGDELTIRTDALGATFRGKWSEGGTTFSGGWRPHEGREGPGNAPYDISGRRAS